MRDEARGDDELVLAVRSGERDAFAVLVDRWFDRCWEVAWRILHDRGLAADVAQDTLFAAWRQLDRLEQPGSFGGWVLRISRNRALDRLERERRTMSIGDDEVLEDTAASASAAAGPGVSGPALGTPDDEVVRADQQELVWAAAAALGERDASLLDLHLRHGLEPGELADELGITPNAAHQALFRLRNRLGDAVRAWLLWRGGAPACVVLQAELAAAGLSTFDGRVVRLVTRHADACVACSEERSRVTAPAALFGAVPMVLAPTLARASVLDALRTAGVPVPEMPRTSGGTAVDPPPHGSGGAGGDPPHGSGGAGGDPPHGSGGAGATRAPQVGAPVRWISSPKRPTSAWRRARVPSVVVVLLLLLGGSVRWGPEPAEPLAPVADAGAGEAADLLPEGTAPASEQDPPSAFDLADAHTIDGTFPDLIPAPFTPLTPLPPDPDETGEPAAAPDDRTPQVVPPPEPPGVEEPEQGPSDEDVPEEDDGEQPGGDDPDEEPADPEEPITDPPTIVRFALTDLGDACRLGAVPRHRFWRVEWRTEGSTSVHLDLGDGEGPQPVDPTGMERRVCLPRGATVELVATNEAGTVSASEEATPN